MGGKLSPMTVNILSTSCVRREAGLAWQGHLSVFSGDTPNQPHLGEGGPLFRCPFPPHSCMVFPIIFFN